MSVGCITNEMDDVKRKKNYCIVLATMHPIPSDLELTKLEILEFLEGLKIFSNLTKSQIIIKKKMI